MGLQLPGQLTSFLNMIGYRWPEADETKLFEMGQKFTEFGGTLSKISGQSDQIAKAVSAQNKGQDITAFAGHWDHADGPVKVLNGTATAANLIGTGMTIISAIVLALKGQVIVQLVTLAMEIAQAIAAAVATFGASLAEIPIFQQITKRLVGMLIDQVIQKLISA